MSFESFGAFGQRRDWQATSLHEDEFAEVARALKVLVAELGHEPAPVIDRLAERGLNAALGAIGQLEGTNMTARYWRCRAQAKQREGL